MKDVNPFNTLQVGTWDSDKIIIFKYKSEDHDSRVLILVNIIPVTDLVVLDQ